MNKTCILLRPYDEAEIDDLCQLERAAHRRYLSLKEYEKFAAAPGINPERFRTGITMVAEFAGHRAGYIIVQPLDGMLYIANLMVDDGMSGKGIGKRLDRKATNISVLSAIGVRRDGQKVLKEHGRRKHGCLEPIPRRSGCAGLEAPGVRDR